jgi:hypothetical protein
VGIAFIETEDTDSIGKDGSVIALFWNSYWD